ncbi:hypothetical protein MAR_008954 [Mya arenaria]|uniref:Uncharacterized protein n=1 Tax=Mya arenaria TaxID=6604 RepID=A0ABY7E5H3_MYAAR|nr:hypothetical protein MAR_008954 [Mya arenaria]
MSGRPQNYTLVLPELTLNRGLCNNSPLRQQLCKDETLGRHAATEVSISLKVLPNSADIILCAFSGLILGDSPTRPVPISSWKGCSHTSYNVRFSGDGRNASPGHSAQYCSYSVIDNETKKVIMLKTVDKCETDRKPVAMEKVALKACLEDLFTWFCNKTRSTSQS